MSVDRLVVCAVSLVMVAALPQAQVRIERLPPLQYTEIVQGASADVGHWGDGRVYVIDLWGTWCAPCIRTIPELTLLQQKYKDRGLVVVGYSWEDPARVQALMTKMGDRMRYTLVNDRQERFLKVVAEERELVEGFPFTFVIDRRGEVAWAGVPDASLGAVVAKVLAR